jgi:hypothetical protein
MKQLLKTNADMIPSYDGLPMLTSAGPVETKLANANIR